MSNSINKNKITFSLELIPLLPEESGMVLQSADGRVQACNQAAEEILGVTLEQLQECHSSSSPSIHPDGFPFSPEDHPAMVTLRTGQPCTNVVMGVYKANEELIWLVISTQPLLGNGSTPSAVVSTFVEISKEMRSQSPLVIHTQDINRDELLSEEAFFFARSLDLLSVIGLDGYFKRVNPMFTKTLGYSEAELLARPFIEFIHEEDHPATQAEMEKLKKGTPTIYFGNRYLAKDGSYRWLEWTASPQVERGMIYCVARDVTQQKQTEIALQKSRVRLSLVNAIAHKVRVGFSVERIITETLQHLNRHFPHFRIAYATVDQKGLLTVAHSIEPSGMVSMSNLEVDLTFVPEYLQALQEYTPVIVADTSSDCHLGSLASLLQSHEIQSLLDIPLQHSNQLVGLLSFDLPVSHDWSEHEILTLQEMATYLEVTLQNAEFQTRLKQSEERWQLALRGSNDGVWDWNIRTNQIFFSTRWKTMLGYKEHEISHYLGEWAKLVHPDDLERVMQAMQDHLAGKTRFYIVEHRLRCKDGSYKWILARSQATRNEEGIAVRMTGSHTDITERKKLEDAIQQANETLEQRVVERTAQLEQTNIALAEREALYRMLAQNIPNGGVNLFDSDLRLFLAEGREIGKAGLNSADLVGKTIWDVLPVETCEQIEPLYQLALAGQTSVEEVNFQNQIYELCTLPVHNEQGEIFAGMALASNITERKQAEAELNKSQAILKRQLAEIETIYESAPIGLSFFNPDLRVVRINQRLAEINGFSIEEHIGRTIQELLPDLANTLEQYLQEVLETGEPLLNIEIVGETPAQPGVQRAWLVSFLPLKERERIIGISTVCEEITERKETQEKLRQFNLLIDLSYESIFVWDIEQGIITWNQGSERLYGYSREEAIGQTSHDLLQTVHPVSKDEFRAILERDQQWSGEAKHTTRTGEEVIVESRQQLIETNGRKLVLETNHDVTARKRAEEALRQSEKRYRTLFESMGDGFCVIEVLFDEGNQPIDYRFLEANPAFEAHTGLHHPEGKTIRELVPDIEQRWINIYSQVALTGEAVRFEEVSEALNRWFEAYAFPIGQPERRKVALLFKDISSRKMLESHRKKILQQEQEAREAAEQANRIKDEFLTILSHELRTPLNPILGWVKLLQTRKFSETKTAEALATIERNARLQTKLIDDLLDVAKILRGKLSLHTTSVNLSSMIESALDTVKTAATAKSISLYPVLPDIGQIYGDAARLQQIVWNLLLNAIKFTPHGGRVDIWLQRVGDFAEIIVKDTGKGIDPDFLPHIFESFRQEDASITRNYGGLGLGLALVRQLVEAHGGTITAESPGKGQGAIFTVTLPVLEVKPSPQQPDELPKSELDLTGIRVLAVDDDPDTLELLTVLLREYNADVKAVASAMEVLTSLDSFLPNVLISDIGMPNMNGYSLMEQVRTLSPGQGGDIPAIALTAYAREEDRQLALDSGYSTHIGKPLDPEVLVQAVASLTQDVTSAGSRL